MSVAELAIDAPPFVPPRRMITVEEWEAMGRAGVFPPEERLELLEGEIRSMAPMESPHAGCLRRLLAFLGAACGRRAILTAQTPLRLSPLSAPEPDVSLLKPRDDFYSRSHPTPADVLLVVEVSDSSLRYDLKEKTPRYAEAGVREVWVVDLVHEQIHRFTAPQGAAYGMAQTLRRGERIETTLPAEGDPPLVLSLAVDAVLGP